jgi:group I intron endonuclease
MTGVYTIKNKQHNKQYIGSSKNIEYRLDAHKSNLINNKHVNHKLQNAWNKYGESYFEFGLLEECPDDIKLLREQFHIDQHNKSDLYNLATNVFGGGGELTANPLYLLTLEGIILDEFPSGRALATFLNHKLLSYNKINTSAIFKSKENKQKYRIVTPEFYNNSQDIISTWLTYSCKTTCKYSFKTYYQVFDKNTIIYEAKSLREIGEFIGISRERVRQILNKSNKTHHETGYVLNKTKR